MNRKAVKEQQLEKLLGNKEEHALNWCRKPNQNTTRLLHVAEEWTEIDAKFLTL